MNFDTRTVIDLIGLDDDLKNKLSRIVDDEKLFLLNMEDSSIDEAEFVASVSPLVNDNLKRYIKIDLRGTDLSFLKGMINLNKVDYKLVFDIITQV
jgi:hypothetical protein